MKVIITYIYIFLEMHTFHSEHQSHPDENKHPGFVTFKIISLFSLGQSLLLLPPFICLNVC